MLLHEFDKTLRIPVVTNLIIPGDPTLKCRARDTQHIQKRQQAFEIRLRQKIKELESVTGQDEIKTIARAHAIRAERQQDEAGNAKQITYTTPLVNKKYATLINDLNSILKSKKPA